MLKCNGKTFMNIQEAVQWLLNNNALIFVCTENYAADTEIPLSALANPSPANPKIGSVVMFADGKISPITGLTDDLFTVGAEYIGPIPLLETIVDKDGHSRFIEGTGATPVLQLAGGSGSTYDVTYAKWSLSGTHFMAVLAFIVHPVGNTKFTDVQWRLDDIPEWVREKIVPTAAVVVDRKPAALYDSNGNILQEINIGLMKDPDKSVRLTNLAQSIETNVDNMLRIQFDLLIDDE